MREFRYVIKDEQGIHARPAGLFVKEACILRKQDHYQQRWKRSGCKKNFRSYGTGREKGPGNCIKSRGQ